MRLAIDLDSEAGGRAKEIQDVRAGGMLLTKAQRGVALTERPPESDLGRGHFAAQSPRIVLAVG